MAADPARIAEGPRPGALRSLSRLAWRRPGLKSLGQISLPVAAFVFVYVAAVVALLLQSFWTTDSFTGKLVHDWNLDNFRALKDAPYPAIIRRTLFMASAVTVTCAVLAVPYAYFLARIASRRLRLALLVATVLPLWVSYLVRVYSWRLILNPDGALNWALNGLGLPDANLAYTNTAMWIVFSYVWLPFMVLPVYAALERIPDSYLEASADLGAGGWRTFRSVILPLVLPGIVAGSIFTFALTLGDYITPALVGGTNSDMIGTVVYQNFATNLPFAAAFAVIPMAIMGAYLLVARRLGAFEAL